LTSGAAAILTLGAGSASKVTDVAEFTAGEKAATNIASGTDVEISAATSHMGSSDVRLAEDTTRPSFSDDRSINGGAEDAIVSNNIGNTSVGAGGKVPVQMYDVMTYGESKAGAVVGDELTGDHIPSYAAIRQNVETTLGRELTADEAAALRDNSNTVVGAQDLHAAGRTYFGANTQAQIAEDSLDLT
jgi:hypothetical protein